MTLRIASIWILPPKPLLPATLRRVRHHLKEDIDVGCQLGLQRILDNSKNLKNDFFTRRETQKFSFREVFVSHTPSMTSGSSVP